MTVSKPQAGNWIDEDGNHRAIKPEFYHHHELEEACREISLKSRDVRHFVGRLLVAAGPIPKSGVCKAERSRIKSMVNSIAQALEDVNEMSSDADRIFDNETLSFAYHDNTAVGKFYSK